MGVLKFLISSNGFPLLFGKHFFLKKIHHHPILIYVLKWQNVMAFPDISPDASPDTSLDKEEPVPGSSEGDVEEHPEVVRGSESWVAKPRTAEQSQEESPDE